MQNSSYASSYAALFLRFFSQFHSFSVRQSKVIPSTFNTKTWKQFISFLARESNQTECKIQSAIFLLFIHFDAREQVFSLGFQFSVQCSVLVRKIILVVILVLLHERPINFVLVFVLLHEDNTGRLLNASPIHVCAVFNHRHCGSTDH